MKARKMWMVVAIGAALAISASAQRSPEVALRAAMETETVKGDLKGAIEQYKKVAQTGNRAVAAQALVRMADCYQKLGDSESRKIYEQIVRDYADQKEAAATAQARLGAGSSGALAKRLVCNTNCGDASLSTDGRFLLGTDWSTGDLAIRDLASGQVRRMMAKPGSANDDYAYFSAFSTDQRQVAYLWAFDRGRGHGSASELRVIANEPGAKPRVLMNESRGYAWFHPVGWSPDGKSILVVAARTLDDTWELAWVSATDGTAKPLKSLQWRYQEAKSPNASGEPRLSPDGRYVAYAALAVNPRQFYATPEDSLDQHIYVIAADGSSETEVVRTAGRNLAPFWAPDGKHLLFLSDRTGTAGLWSTAIQNGKAAGAPSLISSDAEVSPIGITRSGAFYYADWRPGLSQITVADMRTGKVAETFAGENPSWSPDGKSIAFKRRHPGSEVYVAYDLFVHSLETGDEKTFPGLKVPPFGQPGWTHDGKGIITGATPPLYLSDTATGGWKQIQTAEALQLGGRRDTIRYLLRGGRLLARDWTTGEEKEILASAFGSPKGAELAIPSPSSDGRTLVFWHKETGTSKTYLSTVGVDGTNLRDLYSFDLEFNAYVSPLVWSKDSRSILFVQPREGRQQVMRISAEGGKPEFTGVETGPGVRVREPFIMALSPDGSRIAYSSTNESPVQVWVTDNILSKLK